MSFVPNVSIEENMECDVTDDNLLLTGSRPECEINDHTPIRALFEVPHFSIKLCGELNNVERDFVDIVLRDFTLCYEHIKSTVTLFDVSLGGLLVEDLLQDPESPYRHLMCSSAPRHHQHRLRERSLSACPSSLSTSCPVVSEMGLNSNLSSSLPLCLPSSPKHGQLHSLSPLRPLMKSQKFPSMPSVLVSTGGESEDRVMTSPAVKVDKESHALVHIKVLLVDKKDEDFSTKYKSVSRRNGFEIASKSGGFIVLVFLFDWGISFSVVVYNFLQLCPKIS